MTDPLTKHPAKFPPVILAAFRAAVTDEARRLGRRPRLLDPFAGTGRIHQLLDIADTVGVELQPRWAACHERTRVGNALKLPRGWTDRFDIVATSPCYGNRFSDHHNAKDASSRRSYTHDHGEPLHPDNAGTLKFGPAYKTFHEKAWRQTSRVLRPGGLMLLNVSNFIEHGHVVLVAEWHIATLARLGLGYLDATPVPTQRMGHGANRQARVDHELVVAFRQPA